MGLYLGIFLVTLSGLMFEIGLTRIFSATIWYHYAFVAISVALLGWGLGGFALHLLRGRLAFTRERAALSTFLYGLSIPLALWLIVRFPFHPDRLVFYFAVSLLPFFLAGLALSMLFAVERERAGTLYFADLAGASLGALAVTFLLSWLGGESAVLAVSLAPLAASAAFARRMRVPAAVAALAVLAAVGLNQRTGFFNIRSAPTKGLYRHMAATPGAKIALTGWNAYSRIDAVTGFESPYLARLYIDSDAWTNILAWDGNVASLAGMRDWYRGLPFKVAPERPKTLVIGPGGGSDVLVALGAGSEQRDGRRDEPADAALRAPLRRRGREHLRPPAGRGGALRGPHLHPPQRPPLRRDPDGLRGLVGGRRLGRPVALREPPLHGRGVQGVPGAPERRRAARDPALAGGRSPARRERRRARGSRGGRKARRGAARATHRRPRGPAADDLHLQEAAVHRRRDGAHGLVGRGHARDHPRSPRRGAVRLALRRPDQLRRLRRAGQDPRRPRLRRPPVLLRDRQAVGPAPEDARAVRDRARRAAAARAAGGLLREAERRARDTLRRCRSSTSRASASASSPWSWRCCST